MENKKNKNYIVVINGPAKSGKDTFMDLFNRVYPLGWSLRISYADCAKDLFENNFVTLPINRKTEETRKFLADFLVLWEQYDNGPMKKIEKEIWRFCNDNTNNVLFICCRKPDHIQYLKEKYGACTLLITRPGVEPIQSNEADKNVLEYEYDYHINNKGTLDDLQDAAYYFYTFLRDRRKMSVFPEE